MHVCGGDWASEKLSGRVQLESHSPRWRVLQNLVSNPTLGTLQLSTTKCECVGPEKIHTHSMVDHWKFLGGGGVQNKNLPGGGVRTFSGTAQYEAGRNKGATHLSSPRTTPKPTWSTRETLGSYQPASLAAPKMSLK